MNTWEIRCDFFKQILVKFTKDIPFFCLIFVEEVTIATVRNCVLFHLEYIVFSLFTSMFHSVTLCLLTKFFSDEHTSAFKICFTVTETPQNEQLVSCIIVVVAHCSYYVPHESLHREHKLHPKWMDFVKCPCYKALSRSHTKLICFLFCTNLLHDNIG
jgi:hypothetical protein